MLSNDADQPIQSKDYPVTIEFTADCSFTAPEVFQEGNITMTYDLATLSDKVQVISFSGHSNRVCNYDREVSGFDQYDYVTYDADNDQISIDLTEVTASQTIEVYYQMTSEWLQ